MRTSIEDLRRAIEDPCRTVDVCSVLLDAWFEMTPRRLGEDLSKFRDERLENQERVEDFERTFKQLDPAARRRLLGSPWVSGFMDDPHGVSHEDADGRPVTTIEALQLAAMAECPVAPIHSEMGERHQGKGVESPLGEWVLRRHESGLEKVERAKVGDVIALDVDSGLARRHEPESGTFCNPFLSISSEELAVIQEKLEAAIRLVDEATPHLGLLIRTFTRRVFVRKSIEWGDQASPLNLGSEYRPIHAGCIRILNVHRPEMTVDICAEAILHESIHSYLSAYEEVHGKFMSGAIRVRPVSPWSGNFIPNHSLAHAVFVYYAIHHLLGRLVGLGAGIGEEAGRRMKRRLMQVAGGFFIERKISTLFVLESPPSMQLMAVVDEIQDEIRDKYSQKVLRDTLESVA
ncbi:hypothetical protein PWE35_20300 [Stenotrophomonas maltophilia]|uniref:hypothetical protein n=1 Tax=Stenotrophomonas TaxID=40323 RepID=UPI0010562E23|nr:MULTISPECIES: hypothetical protein [Stenotrophomonas]MDQ7306312.1 hypothetical protein [Stenotrophomonas sp. Sm3119]UXB28125.1 hypothetical protein K7568_20425 [Stenotrophomonas maltophilia]WDW04170.1 hypothetical protein PWE35_20300 [Stenotrophomonas maltophilia]WME82660.1 hypothetical protein RBI20_20095 [Stenotrophomonas maltophilia]HEL3259934.1 hypothetical protein [Stenotrophomonas maltophilia]